MNLRIFIGNEKIIMRTSLMMVRMRMMMRMKTMVRMMVRPGYCHNDDDDQLEVNAIALSMVM